jgi:hypothetical protein
MQQPPSRPIRSARDAEEVACAWLRAWGFTDAVVTGTGADEGIDVFGSDVVAQVKAEVRPIGRPVLQSLAGVALVEHKRSVFFALGGYTVEAASWADRADIALFTFDLAGDPEPVNALANRADGRGPRGQFAKRASAGIASYAVSNRTTRTVGAAASAAAAARQAAARGGVRRPEAARRDPATACLRGGGDCRGAVQRLVDSLAVQVPVVRRSVF